MLESVARLHVLFPCVDQTIELSSWILARVDKISFLMNRMDRLARLRELHTLCADLAEGLTELKGATTIYPHLADRLRSGILTRLTGFTSDVFADPCEAVEALELVTCIRGHVQSFDVPASAQWDVSPRAARLYSLTYHRSFEC